MFQQLDLKYFRQHTELTINFEQGVVALRGRNEAGKSTILEAMAYALFGARSLREPLEDVVTWGRKVSELKVKLDFQLNGVDHRITRSKSGAEIRDAHKLLATGQNEVTKYVETLLGASQEVCTKLMLANQDDIKGALKKGPTAAVELIETLSNLGVIDTIIGLVQNQLPSGATTTVEARITTMEEQVAVPVEGVSEELKTELVRAEYDEATATDAYNAEKCGYEETLPMAQAAQAAVAEHARLEKEEQRLKVESDRVEVTFVNHEVPNLPTNIEELRRQVADAQYMDRAGRAATAINSLVEPENVWEGDIDGLLAEIAATRSRLNAFTARAANSRATVSGLISKKITETACGLCGKDLSNVPEVVTKNADLDARIATHEREMEEASSAGAGENTMLIALEGISRAHAVFMNTYQKAAEFVKLLDGHVPPKWEWTGPETITPNPNAARDLAAAEAAERAHHAAVGKKQQLEADVIRLGTAWRAAVQAWSASASALPTHQKALEVSATALRRLNDAQAVLGLTQEATRQARQALEIAEATLRERKAARAALEAQLEGARKELAEIADNNALIKFLREARVAVTDKLWSMVTTTVSSYFSDIRGTQSVVTRSDNGFKVDGHNVAGLSGSTLDALGLAIRKALTKHFLPNSPFLMLDEPAAACDDDRETNMLGLIAGSGFEQVILITHSDLADSFANQVVQL